MLEFNEGQLKALKSKLEADLSAVNRLLSQSENDDVRRVRTLLGQAIAQSPVNSGSSNGHVTAREIRETILTTTGEFRASDIVESLATKFPGRSIPKGAVSTMIFRLKKLDKKLKQTDKESNPPKYAVVG